MISTVVSPNVSFPPLRPHRDIALGHAAGRSRRTLHRGVPVWRAHHHLCAVALLQLSGALIVIAMRVADDHVFNVGGFKPSFVIPSMISGRVAHAKLVSMMMIPALVWSAHDECWRVPSQ
jgi:hypothetical protein